jgi:hypothetical protein
VPLGAQERHHWPWVGEKAAMVKIRRSVIGRRKGEARASLEQQYRKRGLMAPLLQTVIIGPNSF